MTTQDRDRRELTITKLRRDADGGFWRARVTQDGVTLDVHKRYGSWLGERRAAPRSRTMVMCDVLPHVAAALQAKLPASERKIPTTAKRPTADVREQVAPAAADEPSQQPEVKGHKMPSTTTSKPAKAKRQSRGASTPEKDKEALRLRVEENLGFPAIAKKMGWPYPAAAYAACKRANGGEAPPKRTKASK